MAATKGCQYFLNIHFFLSVSQYWEFLRHFCFTATQLIPLHRHNSIAHQAQNKERSGSTSLPMARAWTLPFSPHLLPSKHDNMFKTQWSRECSKLFKHALAADKPYRECLDSSGAFSFCMQKGVMGWSGALWGGREYLHLSEQESVQS